MSPRPRVFTNGTVTIARPKVVRHATLKALVAAHRAVGGRGGAAIARREVRMFGCWAFCQPGQIDYWASRDVRPAALVNLFAHEVAHLVVDFWPSAVVSVGEGERSEQVAETYAAVAGLALEIAAEHV